MTNKNPLARIEILEAENTRLVGLLQLNLLHFGSVIVGHGENNKVFLPGADPETYGRNFYAENGLKALREQNAKMKDIVLKSYNKFEKEKKPLQGASKPR